MSKQAIKILVVAAALVVVAIVVPNTNSFVILLATRALAFSILVMSLDILLGFTGLPSLGQAAYLGVGAYLTAILATRYQFGLGYDFWLVVLFGILIGAALAAVFGLLAIRATGVYFLGLRRADHPEDLAAARDQGFRALYPDHQAGRRRNLHPHGRPDVAAVPQAAGGVRQQEAGDRRRHQL
jgi:Branched-chain amino acid transport system / permease component